MIKKIQFGISKEEAIVLFAYLTRVQDSDVLDATFESEAEQIAFWNLLSSIEKELSEPFAHDYDLIVAKARESLLSDTDENEQT